MPRLAPPRLRGATGHILRLLDECADNGECTLSYFAIARLTGYDTATAKRGVKRLVEQRFVSVTKHHGDRRNTYILHEAAYGMV